MDFNKLKKKYLDLLYKPDKSKKGSVDEQISYLIDGINNLEDYYTTSSCAGRIVIIEIPKKYKKKDVEWLFTSHENVEKIILEDIKFGINPVFFKQESFIIHICARNFEAATRLLNISKEAGFKRAGIIAVNKRFILEVMGSEQLTAPIYDGKKILVDQEYIDNLIELGNRNLKNVRRRVKKFFNKL